MRIGNKLPLLLMAILATACSEKDGALLSGDAASGQLSLNGNCDTYQVANSEHASWSIVDAPEWVTPVADCGSSDDAIKIYVESNETAPRQGSIQIKYGNGETRAVEVSQSTEADGKTLPYTYAVGWSFDVRTYMDSRGLKGQVFNTQKLYKHDPNAYVVTESTTSSDLLYTFGNSASDLSKNMKGKLNINGKYNAFSLELKGSFGKTALSNSKRFFSKIRSYYQECTVSMETLDIYTAQEKDLLTTDFKAARQKVIDAGGSDEAIQEFINHFGTHVVIRAALGGSYDYYFSSTLTDASSDTDVDGAIQLGFSEKFKLKGDVKYKKDLKEISGEKIEKFAVRGGDAIKLTQAIEAVDTEEITGKENAELQSVAKEWLENLRKNKQYELLAFTLTPISAFFSATPDIEEKIEDFMDLMYYRDVPVTRTTNE